MDAGLSIREGIADKNETADRARCLHCGLPVDRARRSPFCCAGCKAVHALLHDEHLEEYYALRGRKGVPAAASDASKHDLKWLEPIEGRLGASGEHERVTLDIQGLHCVGCVWLVDELFARAGGDRIVVNAAIGRVDMVVAPTFDLRAFVRKVEQFGYFFGPPVKRELARSSNLVWRLGICAAIAMNSMIFAIATYAGLRSGPLYELFTTLNLALGSCAVAIGGTVFFRSAWRALRQGVLHLDLPIALGIALAFGGSVWLFFRHQAQGAYFDTLDVFITLMLLGRWLQERAVERNRAWLLASDGADNLLARRVRDARVELVRCSALQAGDQLMVTPGDLLPIDGVVEQGGTTFSLDWIVGESRPRSYGYGDLVPAGAFAVGPTASTVRVVTDFASSPLRTLLMSPSDSKDDVARATTWFQRLSKAYVLGVLVLAAGGFIGWWMGTHDLGRALAVTTAVLIVTCPCAFGIAAPLAYEMVQAGLRHRGLFVRKASFLDRARSVRRVVFDKTGTLTTGRLEVSNLETLRGLPPEDRNALYNLVARSGHPKSAAIRDALDGYATLDRNMEAVETPGMGVEMERDGETWRLGEPSWAVIDRVPLDYDVAFGVDGRLLAPIRTREGLRSDAVDEVEALKDDGYDVWLLSGDAAPRVSAIAALAGFPGAQAIAEQTPESKAAFLRLHGGNETLFVGDGVNDALAFDCALVSGTPAVDRPYLPARADFFFVTPGLAPIRIALRSARVLAQVVRADLAVAFTYNAIAIGLALAGRMSPLLCAVLMPASSLSTIGVTVAALSPRSRLWRS
jgi:Cu2+-exporting ATPase